MIHQDESWSKSRSFKESSTHAVRGLKMTLMQEANFRRQLICFLLALFLGLFLAIPFFHLAIIVIISTIVLVLEIINTSFEALADATDCEYNEKVRSSKDIFAGAVLLASLMATLIGLLILLPPIVGFFT